uniref:Uncharacterized protein n=1 Tax=Rhizophora mucronata TaxID=61149 RepID=A0A2P2PRV7_RHIMU
MLGECVFTARTNKTVSPKLATPLAAASSIECCKYFISE